MNFDEALKAHVDWKRKLLSYLHNPDGSLKAADISLDNRCALGQWIYGDGAKLSNLSAYSTLKSSHERFHREAASVVRKADNGVKVTEIGALGPESPYGKASLDVLTAIRAIKLAAR